MITAVFTDNDDYARTYGLWQWDYGQQLRIEGLHLPTAVEIHFALQETGGEAITRVGTTKDGVTTVTIPDSMLEGNRATWTADKAYNIYAWVYLSDKSSGETIKRITMQVKSRPKPEAFEAPGDGEIFHEAIEAVNDAAKRAEEAGDKAIAAADEAEKAATQTAKHLQATEGLAEQVETNADTVAQDKQTVTGMLSQTQQAASDAALSAQAAKLSEIAAAQAQTGAEAAEDTARQYAEETEADRQAVANDKQVVSQMREAVAADRQAVEQTAAQFGQTSQDALTAIGQARSTAVGDVKAEGQKQTTAVQEAGTQAVSEVTEAKTTAVEAVTTEGDTQTKRVEDAAAGIIADREQINQNKTDIAGLVEGMTDLAPAIHSTASSSVITANDATEGRPFRGLRVFGQTEQVRTTGAQLFDAKTFLKSQIEKGVVSINSDGKIVLNGIIDANNRAFTVTLQPGTYTLSADKPSTWHIIAPTDGVFNQKITVGAETTYNCYIANGTYNNIETTPMINVGSSALPYEPYTGGKPSPSPEYPQGIVSAGEGGSITVEVGGKNLLTGRLYFTNYSNDIPHVRNEDEVALPYAPSNETHGIGYVVPCKPGVQYTFSVTNPNKNWWLGIAEYENFEQAKSILNKIGYQYGSEKSSIKYTAVGNGVLVCAIAGKWTDGKTTIHECTESELLQLEIGSEATTYEPPRIPQSLTLATPNGLPGVSVSKDGNYTDADGQQWVCDEIDLERGKYVQRVVIENISGGWELKPSSDISGRFLQSRLTNTFQTADKTAVCNIASFTSWGTPVNDKYAFALNTKVIYFSPPKGAEITAEELNAKLNSLSFPVVFVGELATPIERDLTPEEIAAYKALRTYGPTTVVSNDAGAEMEATYVADTKAYIQNLEQRLSAKLVNIQSALISQKTSGGGYLTIADSSPLPVEEFSMTGKTEQMKTTGKNLLKPNDHNVYHELPLKAGTVVTLMTNGQLSEGGNIKFIGMENENVWFSIDKGQTRVCRSIGNKDVKGFYNLLTKKEGLEYMLAIGDVKIFEPYSGSFPSPSPDWEQPIEITDQPITITIKGGTEQQSITLTPPRPFTKWDRLEKIDGVWCWVYQSKVLSGAEIKKNFVGMHNSGSMMIKISTLGAMDEQNDAVSDKFIYSTQSVSTLKNGEFRIIYGNAYLKIDGITTDEEGRQWLESNDIIIIAQASAPEYIPLAASEQAQLNALTMYAGTTEITNNGGCTMDLTYTADTKTYIDNKLAAISAAVLEV